MGKGGNTYTTPTAILIEKLKAEGYELEVPFARHALGTGKTKAQRNKQHKYECPECGQSVKSTAELNLKCGICDKVMERAA